jgi:Superinfection immunity protein
MFAHLFFFPGFFGFGFVLYFLPSIIALARSKRNLLAIFLLNFFLGWTAVGWVVALVWAVTADAPLPVR